MKIKKFLSILLIAFAVFVISCGQTISYEISFKDEKVEMNIGDTYELKPVLSVVREVNYSFDKDGIITINGSVVTAVGEGTVVVTAKIENVTASLTIEVKEHIHIFDKEIKNSDFIKSEDDEKIVYYKSCECGQKGEDTFEVLKEKKETVEIIVSLDTENYLQSIIEVVTTGEGVLALESSNEDVVKVFDNRFIISGIGKTVLKATFGSAKVEKEVEIKQNINIICENPPKEIIVGGEYVLDISINYDSFVVTSSDESIIKVEGNTLFALKEGTCLISITSLLNSDVTKKMEVNVIKDNSENKALELLDSINFPEEGYEDLPKSTDSYTLTYYMDQGINEEGVVTREFEDILSSGKVVLSYNGFTVEKQINYKIWGNFTDSLIAEFLDALPSEITNSVKFKNSSDSYGGSRMIIKEIDKPEYLSKTGIYTQPFHDEIVTIKLNIRTTEPEISRHFYVPVVVGGKPIKEKAEYVIKWVFNEVAENSVLYYDSPALPNACDDYEATIEWFDVDGDPVDFNKLAQEPVLGDSQVLYPRITIRGESCTEIADYYIWNKHYQSEEEKINDFVNAINWQDIRAYKYWNAQRTGENYGYIPFYTPGEAQRNTDYIPEYTYGKVRTGIIKKSTEYIVIHDTAGSEKTHTALSFAQSIVSQNNNPSNTSIGWHFSVGNDGIYQSLPLDEVAYHAGDGSHVYGDKFYGSYGPDCIGGGNRNGIGIESCINDGADYNVTMRMLAKLVADLMIEFNLSNDRIKQHWNFSKKDCPGVIRHAGRWQEFRNLVKLEYFGRTQLQGYEFNWESLSKTVLDDTGKVTSTAKGTLVLKYKVTVTDNNGFRKEYSFESNRLEYIDISELHLTAGKEY